VTAQLFAHGVASGDPLSDGVVIWTHLTSDGDAVPVEWTVARDPALREVVFSGDAVAVAERDHTVHIDVANLDPASDYFYGFSAQGEASPIGHTRTLPNAGAQHVRFAVCSCAKYNAGFFNAYARIAERDDLDFVLHLGDYIYEASNTPPQSQTPGADIGRPFDPAGECRTLADYRRRYAQYRRDPDVQRLHHALPMIATLDDHELADGAWAGGSTEHRPDEHGPWPDRRAAALRARWEWLPARPPDPADPTRVFRTVRVGDLADIFLLDIRSRRDEPALEPAMSDRSRSMLGAQQREWLLRALGSSRAAWRVVASPSILTRTWCSAPREPLRRALVKLKLMDEDGEGPDEDQWDGYPAERHALIDSLEQLEDVVVLSADIHVSIAAEVRAGGRPVAVEITAPSLTSQNLDDKLGVPARSETILDAEREFVGALEHVGWCELASHGYVVVDLDPTRVRSEWWLLDGVLERLAGERCEAAFEVPRGWSAAGSGGQVASEFQLRPALLARGILGVPGRPTSRPRSKGARRRCARSARPPLVVRRLLGDGSSSATWSSRWPSRPRSTWLAVSWWPDQAHRLHAPEGDGPQRPHAAHRKLRVHCGDEGQHRWQLRGLPIQRHRQLRLGQLHIATRTLSGRPPQVVTPERDCAKLALGPAQSPPGPIGRTATLPHTRGQRCPGPRQPDPRSQATGRLRSVDRSATLD
jgi:alkaline phosphatase D